MITMTAKPPVFLKVSRKKPWKLLKLKLGTFEQIAEAVSLPIETVQQLAEELKTAKA